MKTSIVARVASVLAIVPTLLSSQPLRDNVPLRHWPAPLYWQPDQALAEFRPLATTPTTPNPLTFIGMTPCRVVDTRTGSGFTGAFGPPSLTGGVGRTFPLQSSTTCSIPTTAQAYSLNITVVPPGSLGYITVWPTGQPRPVVSTLNSLQGFIVANAAIVPAGTSGSIDVYASNATDLIIDINGYYANLPVTYTSFTPFCAYNIPVVSVTPTNMGTIGTFTKSSAASSIVIDWRGHVSAGSISNAVYFYLMVDGIAAFGGGASGMLFTQNAGANIYLPMHAVFAGLAAGPHNVQIWVSIPNGSASNVWENPGCYDETVIVQEL